MKSCNDDTVISTPTITGTLHDTITIEHTPIPLKPKERIEYRNTVQEVIVKDTVTLSGDTIYVYKPLDTIRTLSFNKLLENDTIAVTAKGSVTGRLNDLIIEYKIKPMQIKAPKQSRLGIGVSLGVGIDGKPYAGAGLNYNIIKL